MKINTSAKVKCRTCGAVIPISAAMIQITHFIVLCDNCYEKAGGFSRYTDPLNLLTAGNTPQNAPKTAPESHQNAKQEAPKIITAPTNRTGELLLF